MVGNPPLRTLHLILPILLLASAAVESASFHKRSADHAHHLWNAAAPAEEGEDKPWWEEDYDGGGSGGGDAADNSVDGAGSRWWWREKEAAAAAAAAAAAPAAAPAAAKKSHGGTSRIFAPGVELTPTEEDSPFKTAWTRQLGEQSLLNNIPKEFLNTAGRVVGWLFLDLVFYGGNGIVKGIQAL